MDENMVQKVSFDTAPLLRLEIRIAEYFQGAARNLLGVGRCLNEARENDLVPHGQWEAWVRRTTGMDIRKAQRLMQAAREVPEGSIMVGMPITKITALLQLPEGQREEVAREAQEDNLTVRALQKRVDELLQQRKVTQDGYARTMDSMTEKARQRDRMIDGLNAANVDLQNRVSELQGNIDQLLKTQGQVIDEEVEERVSALRAELEEAKAFAARQARLRQEAQQEMLNASMAQRPAVAEATRFDAGMLSAAVRSFIGEVGVMPHMATELSSISGDERRAMRRTLNQLEDWLVGARKALGTEVFEL